eukprot:TRINITY_DN1867_c0_g1_i17.p1 TRINITY_DN1867_c0_g1~~TRINITY_DN1867_c0_g1_i17.p1  ORF type:complete len:116 (-),score=41.04 TRINITY_DN1867_c0_g1_i17:236-583(-)
MSAPEGSQVNELLCSYAALVLSDCEAEITEESLNAVISAAKGSVPAHFASIFAKVAGAKPVSELIAAASNVSAGPSSGAPAAGAPAGDAPAAEEAKKESSSEDVGGAGGMFEDDY